MRSVFIALLVCTFCQLAVGKPPPSKSAAAAVAKEATSPNNSSAGRPLPLAGSWNCGTWPDGLTPEVQLDMVQEGHHLLVSFDFPPYRDGLNQALVDYYKTSLLRAAAMKIPICLGGTQWEQVLYDDPEFWNLPAPSNPNVIGTDGKLKQLISPFSQPSLWAKAGSYWTNTDAMRQLQQWYPDPPMVLMLSNNESMKLHWSVPETCKQYLDAYGTGRSERFVMDLFGNCYGLRFRALQSGMRQGLSSQSWRKNTIFAGFEGYSRVFWPRATADPNPAMWDGGSLGLYNDTETATDTIINGPLATAATLGHMGLSETYKLNSGFWVEISTWSGQVCNRWAQYAPNTTYALTGKTFSPRRYSGMVQMCMWLIRPRLVRDYRDMLDKTADFGPYFMQVVAACDRVWNNQVLTDFWRNGQYVANPNRNHPVLVGQYYKADEWCLLDTSLDPAGPVTGKTVIPVFATALVMGTAPARQWLIYSHAPTGDKNCTVTLPGYGPVAITATQDGSYHLVTEKGQKVQRLTFTEIDLNLPASALRAVAP